MPRKKLLVKKKAKKKQQREKENEEEERGVSVTRSQEQRTSALDEQYERETEGPPQPMDDGEASEVLRATPDAAANASHEPEDAQALMEDDGQGMDKSADISSTVFERRLTLEELSLPHLSDERSRSAWEEEQRIARDGDGDMQTLSEMEDGDGKDGNNEHLSSFRPSPPRGGFKTKKAAKPQKPSTQQRPVDADADDAQRKEGSDGEEMKEREPHEDEDAFAFCGDAEEDDARPPPPQRAERAAKATKPADKPKPKKKAAAVRQSVAPPSPAVSEGEGDVERPIAEDAAHDVFDFDSLMHTPTPPAPRKGRKAATADVSTSYARGDDGKAAKPRAAATTRSDAQHASDDSDDHRRPPPVEDTADEDAHSNDDEAALAETDGGGGAPYLNSFDSSPLSNPSRKRKGKKAAANKKARRPAKAAAGKAASRANPTDTGARSEEVPGDAEEQLDRTDHSAYDFPEEDEPEEKAAPSKKGGKKAVKQTPRVSKTGALAKPKKTTAAEKKRKASAAREAAEAAAQAQREQHESEDHALSSAMGDDKQPDPDHAAAGEDDERRDVDEMDDGEQKGNDDVRDFAAHSSEPEDRVDDTAAPASRKKRKAAKKPPSSKKAARPDSTAAASSSTPAKRATPAAPADRRSARKSTIEVEDETIEDVAEDEHYMSDVFSDFGAAREDEAKQAKRKPARKPATKPTQPAQRATSASSRGTPAQRISTPSRGGTSSGNPARDLFLEQSAAYEEHVHAQFRSADQSLDTEHAECREAAVALHDELDRVDEDQAMASMKEAVQENSGEVSGLFDDFMRHVQAGTQKSLAVGMAVATEGSELDDVVSSARMDVRGNTNALTGRLRGILAPLLDLLTPRSQSS